MSAVKENIEQQLRPPQLMSQCLEETHDAVRRFLQLLNMMSTRDGFSRSSRNERKVASKVGEDRT